MSGRCDMGVSRERIQNVSPNEKGIIVKIKQERVSYQPP